MAQDKENKSRDLTTLPKTQKLVLTGSIYFCTFAFGSALTILAPCAIDFKNKFETDVQEISLVFTILTASYLVGALICGFIYKFVDRQLTVICLFLLMSTSVILTPHSDNLFQFFALTSILGFGGGGFDAAQAWVIDIWRERSPPFIFGQRFAYSIGAVFSPLLVGPFLTENEEPETSHVVQLQAPEFKLVTPFTIVGGLLGLSAVIQIILFLKLNSRASPPTECPGLPTSEEQNGAKIENEKPKMSRSGTIILVALTCTAIAAYEGIEFTTTQFLPMFTFYSNLGFSKADGAQILFGLTLAFCICRLICIYIVVKLSAEIILCANFMFLISGNLILLLARNSTLVWVGSVAIGCGMSTVYGCAFAVIQKYLLVTDTMAAIITVCGGLVSCGWPILVGKFIEESPAILCYVNFLSIAMLILSFALMGCYIKVTWKEKEKNKEEECGK